MIEEASVHSIPVISLKQSYPGHAKQVGLLAAGNSAMNYMCRFIIIVDEDIDPSNVSQDFPPATGTSPELARHITAKWKESFS